VYIKRITVVRERVVTMSILETINHPKDIKTLTYPQLDTLAEEIRHFLIESVSKTGGHLASNLGVVELTLALHIALDTPLDKIVWDVGHQAYTHKIITGRKHMFGTLRQEDGLSGFPKTEESKYDCFNTGHSSTSISAALGMARARDLGCEDYCVAAVIGDGALTGGMAFEALNDAGQSGSNLIIILNDNEMSILKNVGAMSDYLSHIRTQPGYYRIKDVTERGLSKLPLGDKLVGAIRKTKSGFKRLILPQTIFEDMGFTYLGPIDGHDINRMAKAINRAKEIGGPVLVHVKTIKGKGYDPAETKPFAYHGVSKFDTESGMAIRDKVKADYSIIFGRHLRAIAKRDSRVVAISPAMPLGSGLKPFLRAMPHRFFDTGIAEAHAVTCAAGLAISGYVPVVAIYSSFLQRAYDQIVHDVALQNLHVVLCIDRAGVVGDDGETHQGMFDIAFLSHIPNMAMLAPGSFAELEQMLRYAVSEHEGPISIRYPRGNMQFIASAEQRKPFVFGKAQTLMQGDDVTIIAVGNMQKYAYEAGVLLKREGVSVHVINPGTVKPLDAETILESAERTGRVITVEDGVVHGGAGSLAAMLLVRSGVKTDFTALGYDDVFVPQASVGSIHKRYGLDADGIAAVARAMVKGKG